ncbi:DNA-3-methyladenine glycosylase family protein [Vibrio sp. RC27]
METHKIHLEFNGDLNWQHILEFYQLRMIDDLEMVDETSYSRYVIIEGKSAWFKLQLDASTQCIDLDVELDDALILTPLVSMVRRMLDLDANTRIIEAHLESHAPGLIKHQGIRIPGVWSPWEAGVRAIIGQQVSVKAAIGQLNRLVHHISDSESGISFPTPSDLITTDLSFLKMPQSRKDTLKRFAQFMIDYPNSDPNEWLAIKGIGPWTVNYVLLRGLSLPNCFLDTDLIVKKRMSHYPNLNRETAAPWGSYATFHLWNQ